MKIDIAEAYESATPNGSFIKMRDDAPVGIYYSVDNKGLPSIAFLSENAPVEIGSTQCIEVSQWKERLLVYWSKLSLKYEPARLTFYSLCSDLIETIESAASEKEAMELLANRYQIWKRMFQGNGKRMSEEEYKGLFGELVFLLRYMIPHYGVEAAIHSWSGAQKTAKDFSIGEEWYEVKNTAVNVSEVKISSLSQLASELPGHLCIIKTERMATSYDDGNCMVEQIANNIVGMIRDGKIKEEFIDKLLAYGYSLEEDNDDNGRYKIVSIDEYLVTDDFPRLTPENIPHKEIVKATYTLSIPSIDRFKED